METKIISENLRLEILKMIFKAQSGHPGGSLSIIDILTNIYFGEKNNKKIFDFDPNNKENDYLILSKGHASPALYATLAEAGFFSKSRLENFRQISSLLQGHPTIKIPGVDMTTGSLGQGLSIACGIATIKKNKKVITIVGDGELNEGQIWEAIMSCAQFNLGNIILIVDKNSLQIDGETREIMSTTPLEEKFESFRWRVLRIKNGNNHDEIKEKLLQAKANNGRPTVIIAETIKGKGVSFMEGKTSWHGTAPNEKEYKQAVNEINERKVKY